MMNFRLNQINEYATVSTDQSVFIFGGYVSWDYKSDKDTENYSSLIVEYRDDQWFEAGRLTQPRAGHGAISFQSLTMVIGGESITAEIDSL